MSLTAINSNKSTGKDSSVRLSSCLTLHSVTGCSVDTITCSSIFSASRRLPVDLRATSIKASSSISIISSKLSFFSFSTTSKDGTRLKSNRWHLEIIVSGTLCTSVVASIKIAWGGGSSKVLSKALNASWVSM